MMQPSPSFPVVCYGEILWDILQGQSLPGGAPMNVAYHLRKMGVLPALITRLGTDVNGEKLIDLLSSNHLTTEYVQTDEQNKTGVVNACLGDNNEVTYDIVKEVAWDFISWDNRFPKLIGDAQYFVYGSLTSRSTISRDTLYQLLDLSKTRVLDINLRPPHFNRSSIEYLLEKANILKLNGAELELITNWFSSLSKHEDRMKFLQDRFAIDTVVVTKGAEGAMMLHESSFTSHDGYQVEVADTIGSGDAFLAGLLYQLMSGVPGERALTFAAALGALIASYSGACPNYNKSEVSSLISSNLNKRIFHFHYH